MVVTLENVESLRTAIEQLSPLISSFLRNGPMNNGMFTLGAIGEQIGTVHNIFTQLQWNGILEYHASMVRFYNVIKVATNINNTNWYHGPIVFAITSMNYLYGHLFHAIGAASTDYSICSELASLGVNLVLAAAGDALGMFCHSCGINYVSVPIGSILQ